MGLNEIGHRLLKAVNCLFEPSDSIPTQAAPFCRDDSGQPEEILVEANEPVEGCTNDIDKIVNKSDVPDRDPDDGLRVDWKFIREITDEQFADLVVRNLGLEQDVSHSDVHVLDRDSGAYHYVARIAVCFKNKTIQEFIVRIPGHGNKASWTNEDAHNLSCEVETMRYVREYSDLPAPRIYGYDLTHDNEIGFPFIFMAAVGVKNALYLWYQAPVEWSSVYQYADEPPTGLEKKRVNFLRSLAQLMSSLQYVSFEKIGQPTHAETSEGAIPVVESYEFLSEVDIHKPMMRPIFSTTREFIREGMKKRFEDDMDLPAEDHKNPDSVYERIGIRKIMEIVFSLPVFNPEDDEPETFSLCHDDFDLQNILVNDMGFVEGIIDWDGTKAVPRCIGASSVPYFLRKDWLPDWANNLETSPCMSWNTEHYRQIYAAALYEDNPECADAMFTTKSAIYHAAIGAIWDFGSAVDFTDKLLQEVPGIRIAPVAMKIALGKGWPACEDMLKRELAKIFEPEMPKAEYFED